MARMTVVSRWACWKRHGPFVRERRSGVVLGTCVTRGPFRKTSPSHACASYRAHDYTFALSAVTKVIRSSAAVLFTRCGCGMPS